MMGTRTLEPLAVSASEAAQLLGVSKPKIYELIRREDFNCSLKLGGRIVFNVAALQRWLDEQTDGGNDG